jgi:hypothetical protein
MKRNVSIETALILVFIGVVISGIVISWMQMKEQVATCQTRLRVMNSRLIELEAERAERVKTSERAKGVLGAVSRCLKLTWGLIKCF